MNRVVKNFPRTMLLGILMVSLCMLMAIRLRYEKAQTVYEELERHMAPVAAAADATAAVATQQATESKTVELSSDMSFDALKAINPEIIGWISIEGTNINYPVVQRDNEYYLNHLVDGSENDSGSIFLDEVCPADLSAQHSILYGHNMLDKSMFAHLLEYKSQQFYNEHSTGLLITPEKTYEIQFFAAYVADPWGNSWQTDFAAGEFAAWLQELMQRSTLVSEVVPTESDRIITLSTCSYEFNYAKYVLHGILQEVR